jgi:hypothetical protein
MNERIQKLALDAGLLNYIDNETPRRYFINGHADLEEVKEFAELIVQKCVSIVALHGINNFENEDISWACKNIVKEVKEHFGVE